MRDSEPRVEERASFFPLGTVDDEEGGFAGDVGDHLFVEMVFV